MHVRHHGKSGIVTHIGGLDDSLSVVLEIQSHFFLIHTDHSALDHIALLDGAKRCLQLFFIVLHCLFHNFCPP